MQFWPFWVRYRIKIFFFISQLYWNETFPYTCCMVILSFVWGLMDNPVQTKIHKFDGGLFWMQLWQEIFLQGRKFKLSPLEMSDLYFLEISSTQRTRNRNTVCIISFSAIPMNYDYVKSSLFTWHHFIYVYFKILKCKINVNCFRRRQRLISCLKLGDVFTEFKLNLSLKYF